MTLDELNSFSVDDAASALRSCCGSSKWVAAMVSARPFASVAEAIDAADAAWLATGPEDWHEAFAHHPRIGAQAKGWAADEQSRVQRARSEIQGELAEVNREYEERFGHIYLVCATGRSAEEMLADARERMKNDPQTELRIAAAEQGKIMRLRVRRLLGETS